MAPMTSIMRTALAVMVLGGAQLQSSGVAEARLALVGDGIAAQDLGIMAGAEATRQLRDIEVSEDGDEVSIGGGEITVDDGEVTVGGETVANVTTGEDGGTVNTDDGTVVGFGPDGAGAQGSDGTGVGVGEDGVGVGTSEGTGVGVGAEGAGVGTSEGTGVGVGEDGAGGSTSSGEGFSVSDDGVQVDGTPTDIEEVTSGVAPTFMAPVATIVALFAAAFAA